MRVSVPLLLTPAAALIRNNVDVNVAAATSVALRSLSLTLSFCCCGVSCCCAHSKWWLLKDFFHCSLSAKKFCVSV